VALGGLAAVAALALAVGAYAYFTSNGTGNSSATAGNASTYGVSVLPKPGTVTLYPTTPTESAFSTLYQPYNGVVTNISTGHQGVTLLTANITGVTLSASELAANATCDPTNFSLYSPSPGDWMVAGDGQSATTSSNTGTGAGTTTLPDDLAGSGTLSYNDIGVYMVDQNVDQNGCQGATVSVSVTAS
jgi:hypothetical protein